MLNKGYIKCRWLGSLHQPPHPAQRREEQQTQRGKSQEESRFGFSTGNLGLPALKTAAKYPGVSPHPPPCPCRPLGQLLFHLLHVWDGAVG